MADLSQDVPDAVKDEVKKLLTELGNHGHTIPFYAFFPNDGRDGIVIGDGPLLQAPLLSRLEDALRPQQAAGTPAVQNR